LECVWLATALGSVQRSGICHATQSGGKPHALQSAAARSLPTCAHEPQRQRDRAEERPHHDPGDVRGLEPVPAGEREGPEAVDQQEHAPVAGVVLDPGGDARAEDESGDEAEEQVEEDGHERRRVSHAVLEL